MILHLECLVCGSAYFSSDFIRIDNRALECTMFPLWATLFGVVYHIEILIAWWIRYSNETARMCSMLKSKATDQNQQITKRTKQFTIESALIDFFDVESFNKIVGPSMSLQDQFVYLSFGSNQINHLNFWKQHRCDSIKWNVC